MLQHRKKVLKEPKVRQKVAKLWPKLRASYFSKQESSGKADQYYLGLAIVSYHSTPYQTNSHRVDHEYTVK